MFDFGSPNALFLSFIVGSIGFVLLMYGWKQQRPPHIVVGLVYMAYPYFVSGAATILAIGVALGVGLWLAVRQGY